ncbi:MAG: FAD-dependent oxidoreductase [Burkholderiales bacterium]|nr:MAG: FAD-dependent oxidoreductase [Burkholderiales bacterium]
MESTDLLVVGAGPAGMSAAVAARRCGMRVLVIDENSEPGGQIYRSVLSNAPRTQRNRMLGADYLAGQALARSFLDSGADWRPRSTVFEVADDGSASIVTPGLGAYAVRAEAVLIATGAYERPFPVTGWTLPGVMTAGAAQTLLKASGQVPDGRIVLAGGGPLLWYAASQLRAAGADVAAILSFTPLSGYARQLPALLAAWRFAGDLLSGAKWMAGLQLGATRVVHGARVTRIEGDAPGLQVHYEVAGRRGVEQAATVLVHAGVCPNVQVSKSLRLAHDWDEAQQCWRPRLDAWGASSSNSIMIAGDGAGISGAKDAVRGGALAALAVAARLGLISAERRDAEAAPLLAARQRERRLRAFLDALYAPPDWLRVPEDDATVVCRCEEITAAQVRTAVRRGAAGPNQVKDYVRAGMGACQGRMCAQTVAAIVAGERGLSAQDVPTQHVRPPLKPMHLADLAAMDIGVSASEGRSLTESLLHAPVHDTSAQDATKLH